MQTSHAESPMPRVSSRARKLIRRALAGLCTATALVSGNLFYLQLWRQSTQDLPHPALVMGASLAMCALTLAWIERWRWRRAVREVIATLTAIRAGECAIESLSAVRSGGTTLPTLITEIQAVLRELRQERSETGRLEAELRQRVAARTDALERVIGSLRQQATRDALTGLFNRRFLDQYLPQLYERCQGDGSNLAVLMMDVDHFKQLNDTLGHAAGDEMLKMTSQIIRSGVRGEDAAFRVGGDEFVVLMPGCGQAEAQALADHLSNMVDGLSKSFRVKTAPRLSVGIATRFALSDPSPKSLLAEADRALYARKRGRRRRSTDGPTDGDQRLSA